MKRILMAVVFAVSAAAFAAEEAKPAAAPMGEAAKTDAVKPAAEKPAKKKRAAKSDAAKTESVKAAKPADAPTK